VIWDGIVETFDLEGYPKAKRCYVFPFTDDDKPNAPAGKIIFQIPPVDSPEERREGGNREQSEEMTVKRDRAVFVDCAKSHRPNALQICVGFSSVCPTAAIPSRNLGRQSN
jgi:hypothetical protein